MRFLKIILLLFLFASSTLLKAQEVKWQAERPLVWADFKGKPDYKSNASAVTYYAIVYNFDRQTSDSVTYTITFNLQCVFYTQASWVRTWAHQSDDLLAHEQLHFDIAELYTRKLAAAFHAAMFTSNYKAEIDEIYNKNMAECRAKQRKYDAQVYRSTNMQLRWQLAIYLELKNLPRNY